MATGGGITPSLSHSTGVAGGRKEEKNVGPLHVGLDGHSPHTHAHTATLVRGWGWGYAPPSPSTALCNDEVSVCVCRESFLILSWATECGSIPISPGNMSVVIAT